MFDDDASSVDTQGAVSEVDNNQKRPANNVMPFMNFGRDSDNAGDVTPKEEEVEFDTERVRRMSATRKCGEQDCQNYGGKCSVHGIMRPTCKVKDCQHFDQRAGFCNVHSEYAPPPKQKGGKDAATAPPKKKKKRSKSKDKESKHSPTKRKKSNDKESKGKQTTTQSKSPLVGVRNTDICLDMHNNPNYMSLMHTEFRRMESGQAKTADVAEELLRGFKEQLKKSVGGKFLKKSSRWGEYSVINEAEALEKLKKDISKRHQTTSAWLKEGDDGATKRKLSPTGSNDENSPSKKQKKSNYHVKSRLYNTGGEKADGNDSSPEPTTKSSHRTPYRPLCSEKPQEYVGNYIANLLQSEGWKDVTKKVSKHDFGQVIYRPGCSRKDAVEGENKFTGYAALARWAYENGYYKTNVVETEDGKKILRKAGILDDPYSIFQDSASVGSGDQPRARSSTQRGAGDLNNEPAAEQNPVNNLPAAAAAAPAHIDDDEADTTGDKMINYADPSEYMETFEKIGKHFETATADKDEASVVFYSYLLTYFSKKAKEQEFSLGSKKNVISGAIEHFESTKQKLANAIPQMRDVYENLLTYITNGIKEKLEG